jgi:hypothetical protein
MNSELDSPLACLDLDRYDLSVEAPRLDRHLRTAIGLEREIVLRVTRDPVGLGHVLGRHPHVDLMNGSVRQPTTRP